MVSGTWFERLRGLDVRLLAAIGACLLLIVAIVVTLPKGPDSSNVVLDPVPPGHDMFHAKAIELDQAIEANIDGKDTDFYRVKLIGARGYLRVHISHSTTLIPGVRIYASDKNTVGEYYFDDAGANVDYPFLAQPDTTYYLQIWGARGTIGTYTLTVRH